MASNENHKILSYDAVTGNFESEVPTGDELLKPTGLAMDKRGNLLVSSSGNNQVLSYDVTSPFSTPTILISSEYIDGPSELTIDNSLDILYVTSCKSNRVLKYDFKTGNIDEIQQLTNTGKLEEPYGITIQNNEQKK